MAEQVRVTARSGEAVCVYCRAPLDPTGVRCAGCGVELHAACRSELDRCPTLGCPAAAPRARPRALGPGPLPPRPGGSAVWPLLLLVVMVAGSMGLVWRRHARREAQRVEAQRRAAAQREAAEAEQREAQRKAALLRAAEEELALMPLLRRPTDVRSALGPIALPRIHEQLSAPPLVRVADRACGGRNGLHVDVADLRRLLPGLLLRGLALAPGAPPLRAGDRAVYELRLARQGYLHRQTRVRVELEVAGAPDGRASLDVTAGVGAISWTDGWGPDGLAAARERLRVESEGAAVPDWHLERARRAAQDEPPRRFEGARQVLAAEPDGSRTYAVWDDLPLPARVVVTHTDGVNDQLAELERVAWERRAAGD